MTFGEILAKIVDQTPGALAGAIMASDGIPVEEYRAAAAARSIDLSAVAVEFQHVLDHSRKAAGTLYPEGGEALSELILVLAGHQILFRQVDEEFSLVLALEPTGSLGKARYLARALLHEVRDAL